MLECPAIRARVHTSQKGLLYPVGGHDLKDVDDKMEVFREEYNSDYASPTRWVGTEPEEDISPKGHWYYVKLKMKRGETKTFVTGADFAYEKAFPDRVAFCKNIPFGAKSDYAVFTDATVDGDNVGDVVVLVTSHSIKLSPLRGREFRNTADAKSGLFGAELPVAREHEPIRNIHFSQLVRAETGGGSRGFVSMVMFFRCSR